MAKTHENRTIVVDFGNKQTYEEKITSRQAFIEFIVAFILEQGFKLFHKPNCCGGCEITRHSKYNRKRLGIVIWRVQCKHCKAVFTVLPNFVLRYQSMPVETARQALFCIYGGLSLEWAAINFKTTAMALYRLICRFGSAPMVRVLHHCDLPLPEYLIADEKHCKRIGDKVYLPTITSGRVIWLQTIYQDKSAATFGQAYGEFAQPAYALQPNYTPKGLTCDGFDSTRQGLHENFPNTPIANCRYHAANSLGRKLKAVDKKLKAQLISDFWKLFNSSAKPKLMPVFNLAQKLRRFYEKVSKLAGNDIGTTIKEWIERKKQGWFELIRQPQMPSTTTLLDQVHNVLDRKLTMMKGFHQNSEHQKVFLNGLALLYNFVPYQRRAKNAGKSAVQVQGGTMPRDDWFLSLQILTAGGFR